MTIVGLVVSITVIFVLFWAVRELANAFHVPAPVVVVIQVLLVLVVVLWLLDAFGAALPHVRFD